MSEWSWRTARTVRIHVPVSQATLVELLGGNLRSIEIDPVAARILAVIRADNPLGDFGLYRGVFELTFGLEGFTPTAAAAPVAGARGVATLSPMVLIKTYVDVAADQAAVSAALEQLVRAHPWETPVIELSNETVQLPVRPTGAGLRRGPSGT